MNKNGKILLLKELQLLDCLPKTESGKYTREEINFRIDELLSLNKKSYTDFEKDILRQYQGKGGDKTSRDAGILYEFYTPDWVCSLMYRLAKKYGYSKGKILEPSAATGNMLRPYIENNDFQSIDAFEIDDKSYRICKALYPQVNIYQQYFETAFLQPPRYNSNAKQTWLKNAPYDLVTGNPPYCPHKNKYSGYFTGKDNFRQAEMFFMYEGLKLLKKGGLLVFITNINLISTGSAYQDVKDRIGELADLLDAYRLPPVFGDTAICTDIIILKRK
jgi:type I restriction-modification system DNA methylase subunit